MSDLSKLSNKQLMELKAKRAEGKAVGQLQALSSLTDEQLVSLKEQRQAQPESGIIDTISEVADITAAPTRSALMALAKKENPFSAFASQFGEPSAQAPTGREVAKAFGASDQPKQISESAVEQRLQHMKTNEPGRYQSLIQSGADPRAIAAKELETYTPAQVAGVAIDIAADPLNLVPVGALSKAAKVTGQGVKTAGKAAAATKIGTIAVDASSLARENLAAFGKHFEKLFNPKRAANFQEMAQIAQANGIDPKILPKAVEWGKNSLQSKHQRFKADMGRPDADLMDEAFMQTDAALQRNIMQISGGTPKGPVAAGNMIREGYDEAVENLSKRTDWTYDTIQQANPGMMLTKPALSNIESKLSGIEKYAKGRMGVRGLYKDQAEQLLDVVNWIRESNGSFKQMVDSMRVIGDYAFKSRNYMDKLPPDVEKMRDIYFTIQEALFDTVKSQHRLGPQIADDLKRSNEIFSEFFKDRAFVKMIGDKTKAGEDLFNALIKSGDTNQIAALKRLLSPEKIQSLKGEFLDSLIKRNIDGELSFRQLSNALREKRHIVEALFEPQEFQKIADVIRLAASMGERKLSFSGTGSSNAIRNLFVDPAQNLVGNTLGDTVVGYLEKRGRGLSAQKALKSNAQKPFLASPKAAIQAAAKPVRDLKWIASLSPALTRAFSNKDSRGEDRWALTGAERLLKHSNGGLFPSEQQAKKFVNSAKGRELLIAASNYQTGSEAMKKIIEKIQKQLKENP